MCNRRGGPLGRGRGIPRAIQTSQPSCPAADLPLAKVIDVHASMVFSLTSSNGAVNQGENIVRGKVECDGEGACGSGSRGRSVGAGLVVGSGMQRERGNGIQEGVVCEGREG
eukprot:1344417-Alexandrium_andersonii.AAC.1